ncbi:uncharacterized protein LOC111241296 [Vigna radiata var. radiata]|uniref:Uncharacterized protein LOC111241296 n=1 Tax=Vigna radiata var. radiata TaxID=3916 RepID=A0A3Q0EWG9_VIGRR|nr:uncharacterized protein LOC111241296 [Vigna radiata var. radiata]
MVVFTCCRKVNVLEAKLAEEKARRTTTRPTKDDAEHGNSAFLSPDGMSNNEPGGFSKTEHGGMSQNTPDGMCNTEPQMKTYVRMERRMRYKSQALRTPYTGNVGPRKKNE